MKECPVCHLCFGDHMKTCDQDQSPLVALLAGAPIIGKKFRLDRKLASGSLSLVFQGTAIERGEPVLVKIIHPELQQADNELKERFGQKLEAISALAHVHIARVIGYGQNSQKYLYLITEFLQGSSLAQLLENGETFSLPRALAIISQVCEAIASAHRLVLQHRDLKPSNIFITVDENGQESVQVIDFGLADLKTAQLLNNVSEEMKEKLLGLPVYQAPEQFKGGSIDSRADIYSIGAILYHMLTGQPPFFGSSYTSLKAQHTSASPQPLRQLRADIPPTIESIVMKSLEKRPAQRPTSALALAVQFAAQKELLMEALSSSQPFQPVMKNSDAGAVVEPLEGEDTARREPMDIGLLEGVDTTRREPVNVAQLEAALRSPETASFLEKEAAIEDTRPMEAVSDFALTTQVPMEKFLELTPGAIIYLFANQFLPPLLANQRRRRMHNGFVTERERIAALLLVASLFSLRERGIVAIVAGSASGQKWQRTMRAQRNEGFVIYATNPDAMARDSLESKILSALKQSNPIRFYNIFLHIAQISVATREQEAICEIVSDCIADELVVRKFLRSSRRTPPFEAGESAIQYELAEDLSRFNHQATVVQQWLLAQQQQPPIDLVGKPVQPFAHILKYYTDLFRHNSRELMSTK